jgi:hypothetical protein
LVVDDVTDIAEANEPSLFYPEDGSNMDLRKFSKKPHSHTV